MYILIVEDQRRLAHVLAAIMEDAGYEVDTVFDGSSGLEYALLVNYDAIILDVMLPAKSGLEVVTELRRAGKDTPVILLTAKDSVRDKISGLDLGADDYLTKPFNPAELLARIRALTRRQGTVVFETIALGNTSLDLSSATLSVTTGTKNQKQGEKGVHLSNREFEVMKLLMLGKGRTFAKQDILRRVWGEHSDAEENNVEAYISFLRKKLTHLGSNLQIITLRQLGYRIETSDAG
ncbi:MAG: response regulator transcription factor [Coriobacteriales bacterium]|jgi:DNA-binding response OmpR family regulator|nr:response regulator transcription factor [Coriobacteriales bacterium]